MEGVPAVGALPSASWVFGSLRGVVLGWPGGPVPFLKIAFQKKRYGTTLLNSTVLYCSVACQACDKQVVMKRDDRCVSARREFHRYEGRSAVTPVS